jgi:nucleotide sugar dehydrogenase
MPEIITGFKDEGGTVAVVGLGKIGLPLACQFADAGLNVFGVDTSLSLVDLVNKGELQSTEPGLEEKLQLALKARKLVATHDLEFSVSNADYVVIIIPLYVDDSGAPDFKNYDQAIGDIGRSITRGTTVIVETTMPIGTTRQRFLPILESTSNMVAGEDFFLAFSPERVSSGSIFTDFSRYPKLVGGINEKSANKAARLYSKSFVFEPRPDLAKANGVWILESSESAEFAKLAETTYRDVNIALANTFAEHARDLGIDFQEVMQSSNSQPFSHIHTPGISVGGHCIPVYPHFYLHSHKNADIVSTSREVNVGTTRRAVDRVLAKFAPRRPSRVLISGLSYRTGVKEHAFSGAKLIADRLSELAIPHDIADEMYSASEISELGYSPLNAGNYDILIINSGSKKYQMELLSSLNPDAIVLDGRRTLSREDWPYLIH